MRRIVTLCLALTLCAAGIHAQKGMQGVGVNLGMNGDEDNVAFGGGIKYQYNITDYLRFEPSFSFYDQAYPLFTMTAFANLHLFPVSPRKVRPYLFIGAGYGNFQDEHSHWYRDDEGEWLYDYVWESDDLFAIDGGLGADWRITHNVSMQVEAGGITGIGDSDWLVFKANIGIVYNF